MSRDCEFSDYLRTLTQLSPDDIDKFKTKEANRLILKEIENDQIAIYVAITKKNHVDVIDSNRLAKLMSPLINFNEASTLCRQFVINYPSFKGFKFTLSEHQQVKPSNGHNGIMSMGLFYQTNVMITATW